MIIRHVKNSSDLEALMRQIGVTDEGIGYMVGKGLIRVIQLGEIDTRGANILKQEALSCGADLALPRDAAGFSSEKVDGILMATDRQILKMVGKLKVQPFGLKDVAAALSKIVTNFDFGKFVLKSSHGRELKLDRAVVMGVLNITPDSFSDGGRFWSSSLASREIEDFQGRSRLSQNLNGGKVELEAAVSRAKEMEQEGAVIIDIGGESTGPGSEDVSLEEELGRVIPVVESVRKELPDVFISIDTWKSEVAQAAIDAGADMVNDVTAGRGDERILGMDVPMVLMYSKDSGPRTSTDKTSYEDVMRTVIDFLEGRMALAKSDQIVVDPGMGAFVSGDPKYSFEILGRLEELRSLGRPILVGASRKSFLGGDVDDRLEGSLAASVVASQNGAKIIRAHDVKETVKALKVVNKVNL